MAETGLIYKYRPCPHCGGEGLEVDQMGSGAAMRNRRVAAGVTARDMAQRLGYSDQYIGDLELGRRHWKATIAAAYLKALEGQ